MKAEFRNGYLDHATDRIKHIYNANKNKARARKNALGRVFGNNGAKPATN